ncbi:Uncharacterised protein [Vibrio cholerae]|uniref:Uncharacterized protein n=1 Tax=Vibrio cholerae TaxID=666 RepID=A0A656A149_VIBCL|nr:Uncharacterised protein [Vibrio cholerae]
MRSNDAPTGLATPPKKPSRKALNCSFLLFPYFEVFCFMSSLCSVFWPQFSQNILFIPIPTAFYIIRAYKHIFLIQKESESSKISQAIEFIDVYTDES